MNTPIERLQTALETLGLKAVEARLENLLEQASKKEPSYADFLDELLNCEVEARRTRYLRARLQLAHLPFVKTFEQFDFGFQPSLDDRQIRELRSLRFIHEASNVIFLGPPGVGKTHLSVALAEEAIRSGLGAYFITAHDLAADLGRAYREGRLDRRMRVYLAPKVLVIDEVGYLPLDDLGATIFFQLVTARDMKPFCALSVHLSCVAESTHDYARLSCEADPAFVSKRPVRLADSLGMWLELIFSFRSEEPVSREPDSCFRNSQGTSPRGCSFAASFLGIQFHTASS